MKQDFEQISRVSGFMQKSFTNLEKNKIMVVFILEQKFLKMNMNLKLINKKIIIVSFK